MRVEQIIGTWKLKEFTISANGKTKPWRENMHGLLMYNSDGYMSVAINSKTGQGLKSGMTGYLCI